MQIYNSLTRQVEDFVPLTPGKVGMYTCGVTVYDYAHLGHGRKYVNDDCLRRVLTYNGYKVTHVQNVTDVGHLVSDADEGEDKIEKGAIKSGKSVWETAEIFIQDFFLSMEKLNILKPDIICRATDHIPEQIELIKRLFDKGLAYDTPEAIYFDIARFPKYGQMLGQNMGEKLVGAREEVHTGSYKKHPTDFVLWFKLTGRFEKHVMQWDSPWGKGFPGWHIECSAMAMKYLGESFDIHTGGEDHLPVHHPNEIAQSEGATGKPFAKYWFHTIFLLVDGRKMSKSLGNFYRIDDILEKGFSPIALRYLFMTAHYRSPLNFTWSSLTSAQRALDKLKEFVGARSSRPERTQLSEPKLKKIDQYRAKFLNALNDDLNFPQALAVVWEMVKSNIPDYDKRELLLDWDQVLGLNLNSIQSEVVVPELVKQLVQQREDLRKSAKFALADEVRKEIELHGFLVKDTANGTQISSRSTSST